MILPVGLVTADFGGHFGMQDDSTDKLLGTGGALKKALPLLVEEEYHSKTTYGYARGSEPVRFVSRILVYFDIIKQKWIKESKSPAMPDGSTAISFLSGPP